MLGYIKKKKKGGWSQGGACCVAAGGGREEQGAERGRMSEAVVTAGPSAIVHNIPAQDLR